MAIANRIKASRLTRRAKWPARQMQVIADDGADSYEAYMRAVLRQAVLYPDRPSASGSADTSPRATKMTQGRDEEDCSIL